MWEDRELGEWVIWTRKERGARNLCCKTPPLPLSLSLSSLSLSLSTE